MRPAEINIDKIIYQVLSSEYRVVSIIFLAEVDQLDIIELDILWDGVVATSSPWMAAQDALNAQPCTFEDTILHHRLYHVLATCGCKAACRRGER